MSHADHTTSIEFRDIPNYPGYRVDSEGFLWSRWGKGYWIDARFGGQWKRMACASHEHGYRVAYLHLDGKKKKVYVHVLVAEAFLGPRPHGLVVRHLDGDPTNNHPSNLAWGTMKENSADTMRHGRVEQGSQRKQAKIVESDVPEICRMSEQGMASPAIAEHFPISPRRVRAILSGQGWKHVSR